MIRNLPGSEKAEDFDEVQIPWDGGRRQNPHTKTEPGARASAGRAAAHKVSVKEYIRYAHITYILCIVMFIALFDVRCLFGRRAGIRTKRILFCLFVEGRLTA